MKKILNRFVLLLMCIFNCHSVSAETYTLDIYNNTGYGCVIYGDRMNCGGGGRYEEALEAGASVTLSFRPNTSCRLKSVKVNDSYVDAESSYTFTMTTNTKVYVEFEEIRYTMTLNVTGNGSVQYDGNSLRNEERSFSVLEGSDTYIFLHPDDGYRVKSAKVNDIPIDFYISLRFTLSSNTKVEIEFEPISSDPSPAPTQYTLSIKASSNGYASYDGENIRGTTKSYTVNEGTNVSVSFNPDSGYRIKSVKVNNSIVSISSSYSTILNGNISIEVEFEAKPVDPTPDPTPSVTTYTLSVSASGSGYASYSGTSIRNTTSTFTLDEGTSAIISFSPDDGYRIASVRVNGSSVSTSSSVTMTMNSNTTVAVVFEEIPVVTYTLSVRAKGNGEALYSGSSVRNGSRNFTVNEGSSPRITFSPDLGNRTKAVKLNGSEVSFSDNRYTISNVSGDNALEVEFEELEDKFISDGLNYEVSSFEKMSVKVGVGDFGLSIEIPKNVVNQDVEYIIEGISDEAMNANKDLAAIIWNPSTMINFHNSNPNLLLYVTDLGYAPTSINNVVVDNIAKSIVLTDAENGNNFYCPRTFTTEKISYAHRYRMRTGVGESRGWETIALPFDVQEIEHVEEGEIIPFAKSTNDSDKKAFWLYQLSGGGFVEAGQIEAYTPYIISMPNNSVYLSDYILRGTVIFSATNVEVKKSDDMKSMKFNDRTFVPNFINREAEDGIFVLNVNNDYNVYQGNETEGSKFIKGLRRVHPFEAYMISASNTRSIGVFDGQTTAIREILIPDDSQLSVKVYNLRGQLVKTGASIEEIKQGLPAGVYIVNNKKIIIK